MKGITLRNDGAFAIEISAYRRISGYDSGSYKVLMSCTTGEPALLVKDEGDSKVLVMAFSVHFSNIGLLEEYPRLFLNAFDYFFPPTIEKSAYEVGDSITVNSRGDSVTVYGTIEPMDPITEFPSTVTFNLPGTYGFSQITHFGKELNDEIFVNIPAYECDIWKTEDGLTTPYRDVDIEGFFKDMLLYFAIGLVSFILIERLLHVTEGA